MKKTITIILSFVFLLSLCACGGKESEQAESSTGENAGFGGELLEQLQQSGYIGGEAEWVEVDQDAPFGEYRTEDELLAILESGDFSGDASADPVVSSEPVEGMEDIEYDTEGTVGTFSYDGWGEGVTFWDWQSELSAEQLEALDALAEFDASAYEDYEDILNELDGTEIPDMGDYEQQLQDAIDEEMSGIDQDELQQQIDEAMKQAQEELEGTGYEDMLDGMDIDLNDILNNLP